MAKLCLQVDNEDVWEYRFDNLGARLSLPFKSGWNALVTRLERWGIYLPKVAILSDAFQTFLAAIPESTPPPTSPPTLASQESGSCAI